MSNAYEAGVGLAFEASTAEFLDLLSTKLLGVHRQIEKTSAIFTEWKTATERAATAFSGSSALRGLTEVARQGEKLLGQQEKLIRVGCTHAEIAKRTADAYARMAKANSGIDYRGLDAAAGQAQKLDGAVRSLAETFAHNRRFGLGHKLAKELEPHISRVQEPHYSLVSRVSKAIAPGRVRRLDHESIPPAQPSPLSPSPGRRSAAVLGYDDNSLTRRPHPVLNRHYQVVPYASRGLYGKNLGASHPHASESHAVKSASLPPFTPRFDPYDRRVPAPIRHNNPLAVIWSNRARLFGAIGRQGLPYARGAGPSPIFASPADGYAYAYDWIRRHAVSADGTTSIADILRAYRTGNAASYLAYVSRTSGFRPKQRVRFSDFDSMWRITRAMQAWEATPAKYRRFGGDRIFTEEMARAGYNRVVHPHAAPARTSSEHSQAQSRPGAVSRHTRHHALRGELTGGRRAAARGRGNRIPDLRTRALGLAGVGLYYGYELEGRRRDTRRGVEAHVHPIAELRPHARAIVPRLGSTVLPKIAPRVHAAAGTIGYIKPARRPIRGARADGGPIEVGTSYLVGKRGPEILAAVKHGVVTPLDRLAALRRPRGAMGHFGISADPAWQRRMVERAIRSWHPARNPVERAFDEKAPRVMDWLIRDFHLTPEQAAFGPLGNWGHESGLRAIEEGSRGRIRKSDLIPGKMYRGFGWPQWTNTRDSRRRSQFFEWAYQHHLNPRSDDANYGFAAHELRTDYRRAIEHLRHARTPWNMMHGFEEDYERAALNAKDFYDRLKWGVRALRAWRRAHGLDARHAHDIGARHAHGADLQRRPEPRHRSWPFGRPDQPPPWMQRNPRSRSWPFDRRSGAGRDYRAGNIPGATQRASLAGRSVTVPLRQLPAQPAVHIYLDGRKISENTTHHQVKQAFRPAGGASRADSSGFPQIDAMSYIV